MEGTAGVSRERMGASVEGMLTSCQGLHDEDLTTEVEFMKYDISG